MKKNIAIKLPPSSAPVTCSRHREERLLLSLTQQLNHRGISEEERRRLQLEIDLLQKKLGWV